jgi:hypothetical protein
VKIRTFIVAFWLLVSACHTTVKINQQTLKQIPSVFIGNFKDDYGSSYTITSKVWIQDKRIIYHLLQYNNAEKFLIAKNDEANPSDGGLYTRIDLIYFKNMKLWQWGYCLTVYKASTMQEAINTAMADRANPRKGCNGYPFSRMKQIDKN